MIDPAVLPGFLTAIILVTLAPGPDNIYIAAVAVDRGTRAGVLSAIGMALGMLVHVTAAALGLALLLHSAPAALNIIRLGGAAYLAWLALTTLRSAGRPGVTGRIRPPDRQVLRRAVLTNLTNPKVILFFAAFLPQFVDDSRPAAPQLLVLGLLFSLLAVTSDSCWALASARAKAWFARKPARLDRLGATGGVMMIGLGAALATTSNHS